MTKLAQRVIIDTEATDDIFAGFPALTLTAVRFAEPWNGFPVPVTTAVEFSRFVAAWDGNDPNGAWDGNDPNGAWDGTVTEGDGALIFIDAEGSTDKWTVVGLTDDGAALYALDGWTWVAQ